MSQEKITVSWDELNSRKVDSRLKEQEAMARTREYSTTDADKLLTSPAASPLLTLWRNTIFALTLFGLMGGFVAWGIGSLVHFKKTALEDAKERVAAINRYEEMRKVGIFTDEQARFSRSLIEEQGKRENPLFAVMIDPTLRDDEKDRQIAEMSQHDRLVEKIGNILAYGIRGVMIAVFLAIAMPFTERNLTGVLVNGSVGASLGLVSGVVVALLVEPIQKAVLQSSMDENTRKFLSEVAVWAALGLFLSIAPGIVMRNFKKFLIGLAGGLIGGAIGGVLFVPVRNWAENNDQWKAMRPEELVGLFAGLATGLIENVAKAGWLKVVQGLIAGKQFILYRNPTFVGSGPDCQIYLFRDPKVGRRHAAIHIIPGGYEIEDLPLGEKTLVNGQPIQKTKLRNGDRIQIGATQLVFQEKSRG